ncbi:MAG: Fe-S cluster assembly protein SufD [Acidimicrobiales bacterium]
MQGEPDWLTLSRREAAAWVSRYGYPTRKDEDWRYIRLEPLLDVPFESAEGAAFFAPPEDAAAASDIAGRLHGRPVVAPATEEMLGDSLGCHRVVLVDGRVVPELSRLDSLPDGVRVRSLASELASEPAKDGGRLVSLLSVPAHGYRHAFRALSDALFSDAALVDLAAGAVLDDPLEIVFISSGSLGPRWSSPRSVILSGEGSSATIIETYLGAPGPYVTNSLTQLVLDRGARLAHYKLQDEGPQAFHLSSLEMSLGPESKLSGHLLSVGAHVARHEVVARLDGEGAGVDLDGLYLPRADQHHDIPILVDHVAPGCSSRQLYKGIVDDGAHGVFNGHVVVRPGAVGTDAQQTNKNLLLSDRAEVDTRPRLEIFADDVACTHGAAVGQLDGDALFYLRSRGIPDRAARQLLVEGFAQQVLDRFEPGAIKQRASDLVVASIGSPKESERA